MQMKNEFHGFGSLLFSFGKVSKIFLKGVCTNPIYKCFK